MKKRLILSIILAAGLQTVSRAQEADTLMKLVLEQNRELKVAREALQVALLEAGTGNTPPDPEVEFAYLFGNPENLGNRVDFGVTQQLDFPTAYVHRSKLKKIKSSQAELEYILTRQEVLLKARQLWIEQIHLNQLRSLLGERLSQAETIHSNVGQQLDAGEVGLLEVGQTTLFVTTLEGEYDEVLAQAESNRLALKEITGGVELEILETLLPRPEPIIADSLLKAYRLSPSVQYYEQELQMKEAEKNLAISYHLPKLSAGYYSESVLDVAFRGVRVGVSVPLWENANTVKKAESEVAFAGAEMDRYLYQQEREILQKLYTLETLRSRVEKLEEALESVHSSTLLANALEKGEISLSEYFYSSDFYFRNQQLLLRYSRDLLIQETELLKVYL